jgi:hypothetical protein
MIGAAEAASALLAPRATDADPGPGTSYDPAGKERGQVTDI